MQKIPTIKQLIICLNLPRLIIHILLYYIHINILKADIEVAICHRHFKTSNIWGLCYLLVFDKTYRNLFYWRIGKLKYLCYYWLPPCESFTIATNSKIASGFLCIHSFASIVNAEKIGKGFVILNNVTIGNNKSEERPIIGNNVRVNANAVVVGKIQIGDNVVVGAGSVLTKSVPDNCVVVGNPAYILKENGKTVKRPL